MITKLLITLSTLLLLLGGCEKKEQAPSKIEQSHEMTKPTVNLLTLTATDNKTFVMEPSENGIKFHGLEGKIVLLDFFATWCPPCRAEMPHLVNLQKKYEGKIQILSVLLEKDKPNSEVIAFAKEYQMNFPILNSKENFYLDQALGGIQSLPTLVVYDKEGNYADHFTGAAPEEMIEAVIQKALSK